MFKTKIITIPYTDITKVFIQRDIIIYKLTNTKSLFVDFSSPYEPLPLGYPIGLRDLNGVIGKMLAIHGLTPQDAEKIKDKILEKCKQNPPVVERIEGMPYANLLGKIYNRIVIALIVFIALVGILSLIFILVVKLFFGY